MSLRSFLATARAALTAPAAERSLPLTFVVGNESAGKSLPPGCLIHFITNIL